MRMDDCQTEEKLTSSSTIWRERERERERKRDRQTYRDRDIERETEREMGERKGERGGEGGEIIFKQSVTIMSTSFTEEVLEYTPHVISHREST